MRINDALLKAEANNFTLVRLVLASSVIYTHCYWKLTGLEAKDDFSGLLGESVAGAAVQGFFFLSGFLVYASLLRIGGSGRFATARLARLWPGLITALIVVVLAGWAFTATPGVAYFGGDTAHYLLGNASFVKGYYTLTGVTCGGDGPCNVNGSLWTLPFEARCYAVLALLNLIGLAKPEWMKRLILPGTMAAVVVWTFPPVKALAADLVGKGIAYQFDAFLELWAVFAMGAAAFLFRDKIVLSWWVLAGLAAANFGLHHTVVAVQMHWLLVAYAVLCGGLLSARKGPVSARWPDYSYGIYIYAFPIMVLIAAAAPFRSHWLLSAATFAATVPVAALSWHFVEKPALDAFHRVRRARARPATA